VTHHVVAVVAQPGPVKAGVLDSGGPVGLAADLRGAQQCLGRDAGPVGAFTADQFLLDDGHGLAGGEQPRRGDFTAGSHADHDHVELLSHWVVLVSSRVVQGRLWA